MVPRDSLTERQRIDRWASAKGDGLVEYVLLEEHIEPAIGRELPDDAAIVAGLEERVDQHDQQRARGGEDQDQQRRREQEPAPPRLFLRPEFGGLLDRRFGRTGGIWSFYGCGIRHGRALIPQNLDRIGADIDTHPGTGRELAGIVTGILHPHNEVVIVAQIDMIMGIGAEIDDVVEPALKRS